MIWIYRHSFKISLTSVSIKSNCNRVPKLNASSSLAGYALPAQFQYYRRGHSQILQHVLVHSILDHFAIPPSSNSLSHF